MIIAGIFVGVGADISGDIHVRCWRKSAAVRLVVAVGGCRPRWLVVALVLLGVPVLVLVGFVVNRWWKGRPEKRSALRASRR